MSSQETSPITAGMIFPQKSFHLPKVPQPLSTPEEDSLPPTQFRQSELHWYDSATVVVRVSTNFVSPVVLDG
jgi:hypothetical protein